MQYAAAAAVAVVVAAVAAVVISLPLCHFQWVFVTRHHEHHVQLPFVFLDIKKISVNLHCNPPRSSLTVDKQV